MSRTPVEAKELAAAGGISRKLKAALDELAIDLAKSRQRMQQIREEIGERQDKAALEHISRVCNLERENDEFEILLHNVRNNLLSTQHTR